MTQTPYAPPVSLSQFHPAAMYDATTAIMGGSREIWIKNIEVWNN